MKRHKNALPLFVKPRHVDPSQKLILCGASFLKGLKPRHYSARIAYPLGDVPRFPAYTKARAGVISAHDTACAWVMVDFDMQATDPKANEPARCVTRYFRFRDLMLGLGFTFDWQCEGGYMRFSTQTAFEDALQPAKQIPLRLPYKD